MQPVEHFRHEDTGGDGGRLHRLPGDVPRRRRERIARPLAASPAPAPGYWFRCVAMRDRFYRRAEQRLDGPDAFGERRCARLVFNPAVLCLTGGETIASVRNLDPAPARCCVRFHRALVQPPLSSPPWRRSLQGLRRCCFRAGARRCSRASTAPFRAPAWSAPIGPCRNRGVKSADLESVFYQWVAPRSA
jgi:hypothetical protein